MRINLYLAKNNIASRRKADELISEGKVYLNDKVLKELGYDVKPGDIIRVAGKTLKYPVNPKYVYYLMNKPKDCLCTNHDTHNRSIYLDYLKDTDKLNKHIFTIGRLDRDTTGALLITNDGDLYNKLVHPRSHVSKTYIAIARGLLEEDEINKFANGLILKNSQQTQPCEISYLGRKYNDKFKKYFGKYKIILKEGKKNQIHLSFKVFGLILESLERTKFANLSIDGLNYGQYRPLTDKEIDNLKK